MNNFKKSFKEKVLEVVRSIPAGTIMSYGEVSRRAGVNGAARAVGTIMSGNTDKSIPCHRVVKADGSVGEYNGLRSKDTGKNAKLNLLKKEGVKFTKTNKAIFTKI